MLLPLAGHMVVADGRAVSGDEGVHQACWSGLDVLSSYV